MPFQPGISGNPGGRPCGTATSTPIPVTVRRLVITRLSERVRKGDNVATDLLAQLILQGSAHRLEAS